MDDVTFMLITTAISGTLQECLTRLPTLVLFAKITPNNIEATVFAVLTGL